MGAASLSEFNITSHGLVTYQVPGYPFLETLVLR